MPNQITSERRQQLAEKHKVNEQYLYQCLTGRREMSPTQARALEIDTGGELTRQMLCQKTYAGIWGDPLPALTVKAKGKAPATVAKPKQPRGTGPRNRRVGKPERRESPRSVAEREAAAKKGV